jgi:hypothetical protein
MIAGPRVNAPTIAVPSVARVVHAAPSASTIHGSTSDSADQKSV